jgi:hypothetical protein
MLNKIYLIAFAVLLIPQAVLTWYAGTWLTSIGEPKAAEASYFYYTGLGFTLLWIAFLVLLILANVILWSSRRAWALWLTFLYFALFIFLRYWWLEGSYLDFARRNAFTDNIFSPGPIVATVLIVGMGALIFFDQFVVLRLAQKMHPRAVEDSVDPPALESDAEAPGEE